MNGKTDYLTLENDNLYTDMIKWIFHYTAQKMKFTITDFFSKCDQIRRKLRIWSHLLKKFVMVNFIFCAVLNKYNLILLSDFQCIYTIYIIVSKIHDGTTKSVSGEEALFRMILLSLSIPSLKT